MTLFSRLATFQPVVNQMLMSTPCWLTCSLEFYSIQLYLLLCPHFMRAFF